MKEIQTQNYILVGVVIGVLFLSGVLIYDIIKNRPVDVDKMLETTAVEINQTCPSMVDEETRLNNVKALPGKVFKYNYVLVNHLKNKLNITTLKQSFTPILYDSFMQNEGMDSFRKYGVTVKYNYVDKNGNFLFEITFDENKYNGS